MKTGKIFLLWLLIIGGLTTCKKPEVDVTGTIEGVIKNEQTSEPIKGANVSIHLVANETTEEDGHYHFEGLEAKEHTIVVIADGYEDESQTVKVKAGPNLPVDFSLTPLVPILEISPINLDFSFNQNVLPLSVKNVGKGTLNWSVIENVNWMSVNPISGTTTSEVSSINVYIDRSGLTPKVYTQNLIINSNGGNASIVVSMIVQGPVPTAIFTVTPSAGGLSESFYVDASASVDDVDPTSSLFVRWRWEETVGFTEWAIIKTSLHQYLTEGFKTITLEVRDGDSNVGILTKTVLVNNDLEMPVVTTSAVINITATSATSGGNVASDGGSDVTTKGVCWGLNQDPTISDNKTTDGSGLGAFASVLDGLISGSSYYVRAYATNGVGTSYGNQIMFIPGQNTSTPIVTTEETSDITKTSATSGGTVSSEGSSPVSVRGVCWSTNQNPTTANNKTNDGGGIGTFVSSITGLTAGTIYYVRAYATNSVGTSYGNEITFETSPPPVVPTVNTTEASNITYNSASGGGNVIADGGAPVTVRGVCWGTSHNPTITNSHTSNGTGIGQFTSNITELTSNTDYYVRAFATNSAGTNYGNEITFKTSPPPVLPTLSTTPASNITQNSAISGGNVTADGGATITERGVCWSTSQNPTVNNSHNNNGSGLGQFDSNITGLSANTNYYIRGYATNSAGTAYGNQVSFTTLPTYIPTLTTTAISNIAQTSATSGGNITSDGGAAVTARGVCWSISQNPTISNSHTSDGSGTGIFSSSLTDLQSNKVYYVRAYATNNTGTFYGNQVSFTTLAFALYQSYGGGIIFYLDGTGQHGLISATSDQSTGAEWGCYGAVIGGTSKAFGTGATNTEKIVAGCGESGFAAKICYNLVLGGFNDWFLPSYEELDLMYENLKAHSYGNFANDVYWSSSEGGGWGSNENAYSYDFLNGGGWTYGYNYKYSLLHVRAIRAF